MSDVNEITDMMAEAWCFGLRSCFAKYMHGVLRHTSFTFVGMTCIAFAQQLLEYRNVLLILSSWDASLYTGPTGIHEELGQPR